MKALFGSALLAVVCAGGLVSTGSAQNTYQQQVAAQFSAHSGFLNTRGYTAVAGVQSIGSLNNGAREGVMFNLASGVQYGILGVCDNDCSDLDLQVYDPAGNLLGEDMGPDDWPVVTFTAPASGQYRVSVIMATCRVSPCYYGVQVFTRGGGGGK